MRQNWADRNSTRHIGKLHQSFLIRNVFLKKIIIGHEMIVVFLVYALNVPFEQTKLVHMDLFLFWLVLEYLVLSALLKLNSIQMISCEMRKRMNVGGGKAYKEMQSRVFHVALWRIP